MVKYLALLLAGILAASCIFDADQCVMSVDEPRSIMFTVSLDNPRTKASQWGEGYDPSEVGVPFDSRIITEDLRMVILDNGGNRVGVIQDLDYWPLNETHTEFQYKGNLPAEFVRHYNANGSQQPMYRFMVLANCGDNMSGEEYITYSQAQLDPLAKDASIPMWGVMQVDVTPLLNSTYMDIGEVSLLRAAAKIEVKLSDPLKKKGTTINSATLKYYNQTGYCLPSGWSQVSDTKILGQESCLRVYRHAAVNLPFVKDENTGDYYVYVTEYDNINYSGERNKISLSFNMGSEVKEFADAISFCEYSDGKLVEDKHYNIVRNHIYEFEILSIAGDNLELQYTVADWDAEQWWSEKDKEYKDYEEHELAYPTYHNPVVPREYLTSTPEDLVNYTIKQSPQMYYNANNLEEGAFECFFQIVAPADVEWKPQINASSADYGVRVYDDVTTSDPVYDTTEGYTPILGACTNTKKWFRIVVFPIAKETAVGNKVDFTISYYQEWTDQYIHLYINGEYDRIRWPGSGTNPKIITIAHVEQQVTSEIDE